MKLADYGELRGAEAGLADWIRAGNRERFVVSDEAPGADAAPGLRLRASFLRALALDAFEDCRVSEKGLQVAGAYIEGDGSEGATRGLDLEGCTLRGDLGLIECRLPDQLLLRGAQVQSLLLDSSTLARGIAADGLNAQGGVFLRKVTVTGEVRLVGAKLGGGLECEGAKFTARKRGDALTADGLEAPGGVFLGKATAEGAVRLLGAKLGGNLDCAGAKFTAGESGEALIIEGAHVEGAFFLRDGAEVRGVLDLAAAEIGHIVDDAACWPEPGNLVLDRCRYGAFIGGPVDAASRLRWLALLNPMRWGQDFWPQPYEECARVLREMGHQGAAREILIEKERLQRRARRGVVLRDLAKAREAFASAALVAGVRVHRDRVLELWLQHAALWLWDNLLGLVVGYGRRPQNAAYWGLGALLVGWFVFAQAAGFGAIKPNLPQIQRAEEWVACAPDYEPDPAGPRYPLRNKGETQYACFLDQPEGAAYPRFNPFVYSADTLIPVVALEMQSYWIPNDATPRGAWARRYLWVHIALGWGLTLLAVAGFSGLIKMDSK